MMQVIELKILDERLGREFPLPDYATAGFGRHGSACLYRRARYSWNRGRRS